MSEDEKLLKCNECNNEYVKELVNGRFCPKSYCLGELYDKKKKK